jgi:hypothetical protein
MVTDLPLRCACGKLQGLALNVAQSVGRRVVCCCDDCQAFARFLGRDDITDEWGGTDIVPMPPARVRITQGTENLTCMRLSEKGLFRWYCAQCKTPIGNTVNARVPFVGLFCNFIDLASDGRTRDEVLGRPAGYAMTKFATGKLPQNVQEYSRLRSFSRAMLLVGKWWITQAGSPSPFFDERTGAPSVEPRILTPDERDGLR